MVEDATKIWIFRYFSDILQNATAFYKKKTNDTNETVIRKRITNVL